MTFLTKCFPQFTRTDALQAGMYLTIFHTNGRGQAAPINDAQAQQCVLLCYHIL